MASRSVAAGGDVQAGRRSGLTVVFGALLLVLLLAGFLVVERRAAEPILPLGLFRNRVVAVASGVGFVVGVALFGSVTFMPLYLQVVKGHTPTASG